MKSITINDATLQLFTQADGLVEIRDPNGCLVGFFAPSSLKDGASYAQGAAQVDLAEIQKRKQPGRKTYTTKEVLEHLASLESK